MHRLVGLRTTNASIAAPLLYTSSAYNADFVGHKKHYRAKIDTFFYFIFHDISKLAWSDPLSLLCISLGGNAHDQSLTPLVRIFSDWGPPWRRR